MQSPLPPGDGEQEPTPPTDKAPGFWHRPYEGSFWSRHFNKVDDRWELWSRLSLLFLALHLVCWILVFMRLGDTSVYIHGMVISTMGVLALPLVFWGLINALFNPPVFRRTRTIAFGAVLLVALLGRVHFTAAPLSTEDWQSTHTYQLPFEGRWYTLAGGEERARNYHATTASIRYGYDFTVMREGRFFEGDGSQLAQHHCFGTPVLAPVAGRVVHAVGTDPDRKPGDFDLNSVLGNHLIIEVGPHEFLFMAHLKQDSLKVREGSEVKPGQEVAACGNSGRSVQPHLHLHLQKSREFPFAEGLPLHFANYAADGKQVGRGMPQGATSPDAINGQVVEPRNYLEPARMP